MNVDIITAIAAGIVVVLGAVTALIVVLKKRGK